MKKTILASAIIALLSSCGGGSDPGEATVRIDQPASPAQPATSSSDLTAGRHIPTISNPNPTPTGPAPTDTTNVTVPIPKSSSDDRPADVQVAQGDSAPVQQPPTDEAPPPPTKVVEAPQHAPDPEYMPPSEGYQRVSADRVDEVQGEQIHVVYAVPEGGPDKSRDFGPGLYDVLKGMNDWMASETGGRRLKIDTYKGKADITFVRLPKSDQDYSMQVDYKRDAIERDLRTLGFSLSSKSYLVFYEGTHSKSCGDSANPSRHEGYNVAVMYMQNFCNSNQAYTTIAALHETLHVLGAVSPNAPMHTTLGHVDDPKDIMYGGYLDPSKTYHLDPSRINYYNPNGLPNGLWNLAMSPYLDTAVN